MRGLSAPSGGLPEATRDWLISAHHAAQTGEARLVPPMVLLRPLKTTRPPVAGSPTDATSGTRRIVPAGAPGTFCQAGRLKITLTPPPLAPLVPWLARLPHAISVATL